MTSEVNDIQYVDKWRNGQKRKVAMNDGGKVCLINDNTCHCVDRPSHGILGFVACNKALLALKSDVSWGFFEDPSKTQKTLTLAQDWEFIPNSSHLK